MVRYLCEDLGKHLSMESFAIHAAQRKLGEVGCEITKPIVKELPQSHLQYTCQVTAQYKCRKLRRNGEITVHVHFEIIEDKFKLLDVLVNTPVISEPVPKTTSKQKKTASARKQSTAVA